MLEEPALLLCPWAESAVPGHPAQERKRLIVAPASGRFLGLARAPAPASWWRLKRQSLQVLESEDASLLMTVYLPRGLRRTCEFVDADERRIGFCYRGGVWDASGTRLAVTEMPQRDAPGRFIGPTGSELATFEPRREDGTLLTFNDVLEGKPFVRMAFLGSVLAST